VSSVSNSKAQETTAAKISET